jgi:transposase
VPEEGLSMRKIREVLWLSAMGLNQHQIAQSCKIVQSTVHKYLKLAKAANLSWPLADDWSEDKLQQVLLDRPIAVKRRVPTPPDFPAIHRELSTDKNLTLELIWKEYRQQDPAGYGYSRFCDLYKEWHRQQDVTLRQHHRPGERMFIDYAGATIPVHDPHNGQIHPAAIFVAVLGASSYTFAEETASQDLGLRPSERVL